MADAIMEINEIREYLPHRYPFLLVDRVLELNLPTSIVAVKNVTINEPFFNGHFPEMPVMPGVLIIEAMAQAAGILGFKSQNKKASDGSIYYFVGIDDARFKRRVIASGIRLSIARELPGNGARRADDVRRAGRRLDRRLRQTDRWYVFNRQPGPHLPVDDGVLAITDSVRAQCQRQRRLGGDARRRHWPSAHRLVERVQP